MPRHRDNKIKTTQRTCDHIRLRTRPSKTRGRGCSPCAINYLRLSTPYSVHVLNTVLIISVYAQRRTHGHVSTSILHDMSPPLGNGPTIVQPPTSSSTSPNLIVTTNCLKQSRLTSTTTRFSGPTRGPWMTSRTIVTPSIAPSGTG